MEEYHAKTEVIIGNWLAARNNRSQVRQLHRTTVATCNRPFKRLLCAKPLPPHPFVKALWKPSRHTSRGTPLLMPSVQGLSSFPTSRPECNGCSNGCSNGGSNGSGICSSSTSVCGVLVAHACNPVQPCICLPVTLSAHVCTCASPPPPPGADCHQGCLLHAWHGPLLHCEPQVRRV
jgi:hypothetical protein